jgi:hypothetical protein
VRARIYPSPVLGWAVHSAALLPIVVWTGFSLLIIGLIGVLCIGLAAFFVGTAGADRPNRLDDRGDYGLSAAHATRTAVSVRRSKKAST